MKPLMLMRTKGLTGPFFAHNRGIPGLSKSVKPVTAPSVLPPAPAPPTVARSDILDSGPDQISVSWNDRVALTGANKLDAFTIHVNGGPGIHPHAIAFYGKTMLISVIPAFNRGDDVTWSYDDSVAGVELRMTSAPHTPAISQTYHAHNMIT